MNEPSAKVYGVDFKDRKGWLLFFGICQCILGILCAMAIPAMLMGIVLSAANPEVAAQTNTSVLQLIPAVLVYALAAGWFVTMGIGSIRCRRWARALTLVVSWFWFIGGIFGFVLVISFMGKIFFTNLSDAKDLPPGFAVIMIAIMAVFMLVLYVLIPLTLVLFYGGKNVKATCEHWDEKVRWTDKCPLPVIGMGLVFFMWGACLPFMAINNWVFPFFGTVMDSYAGAVAGLCLSSLCILLAWRLYKLDIRALWGGVAVICLWFTSMIMTFAGDSFWVYNEKITKNPEQLELMKDSNFQSIMIIMLGIWAVGLLGYLIFIKRYFKKDSLDDRGLILEKL